MPHHTRTQVLGTPEPLLERSVLYNLINRLKVRAQLVPASGLLNASEPGGAQQHRMPGEFSFWGARRAQACALLVWWLGGAQEFSDWGQCQVLELAGKYKPASEAEVRACLPPSQLCASVHHMPMALRCCE